MQETIFSKSDLEGRFPGCHDLGELMDRLETEYYSNGEVICEVAVNDLRLDESDESRFASTPWDDIHHICLKTSPVLRLVRDASGSAQEYILRLIEVSLRTADLFRTDDLAHAQKVFVSLVEGTRWLSEMLLQIKNVSGSLEGVHKPEDWAVVEARYVDLILQTEKAFEGRDYILTADLLEYEWTTALEAWLNLLKNGDRVDENTVGR